jgi:DNA-binding MarR family transcriptional regulator
MTPQLLLENQFCFALYTASRAVVRAYGPLLAPLGLTYPQYLVMLLLWEGDGLSVSALGDRLALDSGTLTPLIKRLEVQQLLKKTRDADDERVVRVTLTAKGRSLEKKAAGVPAALFCAVGGSAIDKAGVARLQQLKSDLESLAAALAAAA